MVEVRLAETVPTHLQQQAWEEACQENALGEFSPGAKTKEEVAQEALEEKRSEEQ